VSLRPGKTGHVYVPIDLDEEVDIEPNIASCTQADTVKGLFFYSVYRQLARAGARHGPPTWQPFYAYPMASYLRLQRAAVETIYDDIPSAEAYCELGMLSFEAFARTMLGRILFRRRRLSSALQRVPEAFSAVVTGSRLRLLTLDSHAVEFGAREMRLAPAAVYGAIRALIQHVGGMPIADCGVRRLSSQFDFDVRFSW